MKKMILLCVAFLSAIATFAQQDANRVFVFTDKDGNAFENGATIERDKLEFDDFEEFKQILSDVYVKQTATDKSYAVSMSVKINSIDNGKLKVCFPMSCLQLVKPGTSDLGKNALSETASYNKETGLASILTEWIPKSEDAWGTCEATFTLTTLIKKSFLDYTTVGKSSDITIRFINRDPSAINGVADNSAAKEVARYTVGGQRINAPVKGINIVKLSDGRTVKENLTPISSIDAVSYSNKRSGAGLRQRSSGCYSNEESAQSKCSPRSEEGLRPHKG